ncbi:MAG: sensor histidine kinase [Sphingobacteriales bacterium]|nr:MAG: sensor histidine kinase [Sphingobacteriales bacterium]
MSVLSNVSKYWWCQIIGWGGLTLVSLFFKLTYDSDHFSEQFVFKILDFLIIGILLSHAMREMIISLKVLQKPFDRQIYFFVIITISFAIGLAFFQLFSWKYFDLLDKKELKAPFTRLMFGAVFNAAVILLVWNLIYFMYHYVEKNRTEQIDKLRMKALIKELELKTIKSHINPHFIFNSLNSIRALVDENPGRARTAITELSNILRSSMQAEKLETVPLEKELAIVKDYLALEQMRFEERLRINFDIDEDTLDQPIPPMMLQTLVENAIKHGISKQVNGGEIKITSDFVGNHHEIIIRNTGRLNGHRNADGFGLQSTQNRLSLMYGDKASFQINDIDYNAVEAKLIMPIES